MGMLDNIKIQVLQADAVNFWFWLFVLLVIVAVAFVYSFRNLLRARIIEDTPTSKIRSAAQGYVELIGRSECLDGPPIIAPLSGRTCTWYQYKIERRERIRSRNRSRWKTIETGVSEAIFRLVDETGECVIDPEGAEVVTSNHKQWYGSTPKPVNGPSQSQGRSVRGLLGIISAGMGRYRYTESLLVPGERLYALGSFQTIGTDNQSSVRQDTAALLRSWKKDRARMKSYDVNGDGKIDVQEWEAVRRDAELQAVQQRAQRADAPTTHMLQKPLSRRRPFLLADRAQNHLAKRYRVTAFASIAGFMLSGVSAVWMFVTRLSM